MNFEDWIEAKLSLKNIRNYLKRTPKFHEEKRSQKLFPFYTKKKIFFCQIKESALIGDIG